MSAARRIFCSLAHFSLKRGLFVNRTSTLGLRIIRPLSLTNLMLCKSKDPEVNNEPIKFSTSIASHRTWKVERSMGSQYERPWWKVLPVSLLGISFLLWCVFRKETDIDAKLEKHLSEHLPGLLSDEQEGQDKKKSS